MKTRIAISETLPLRQSAFTLLEVAAGTAVMAIVFVTIFSVMQMGLFMTTTSRENVRGTQIMLDKMEGIRLYSPTQLTNSGFLATAFTNWFCETNNIGLANVQGYGVMYTGAITIAPVIFATTYSSNMEQITVNVGWVSGGVGNMAHTRSMSTFYGIKGLYNYVWTNGH
jgi:hypothetical protein